jgi:hypothetical protein
MSGPFFLIVARLADLNAVLLAEPVEEQDSLLQHPIPGVLLRIPQSQVLTRRPLAEQRGCHSGALAKQLAAPTTTKYPKASPAVPSEEENIRVAC